MSAHSTTCGVSVGYQGVDGLKEQFLAREGFELGLCGFH